MAANCRYADGFTIWEKLYAQITFNVFCLTGLAAIALQDWRWALPYAVLYFGGVPFVIMRYLACPRCPHLWVYGDCVQLPSFLTKRLVKKRKTAPFNWFERTAFYAILGLLPLFPLPWLIGKPVMLTVFLVAAAGWYLGQWFHFCRHCRVQQCPWNRVPPSAPQPS